MLGRLGRKARFECIWILGSSLLDGLVSSGTSCWSIAAIITVATLAKLFSSKAFAVKLEALGFLAVALARL